jgi:hypothetical protein
MKTAALALLLFSAIAAFGEAKDCINPGLVVADGRIVNSPQFPGSFNGYNPTFWYSFYGQAMHSYSIEFVPTLDNENTSSAINFVNLSIWGPNDISALQTNGCFGGTTVSWTATQGASPVVARSKYGSGQRASLIAQITGLYILSITNTQAAGPYSYRIVDTTLFNPRWSTWSGYDSSWGFTNMSDMTITGTLYVLNTYNQVVKAAQVTVPANGQVFRVSNPSDLNVPRNVAGDAIFAHNGPPSAIVADSYMVNSNATVITYTKFESRSTQ